MPKDSLKSSQFSCEASERYWDKKQPYSFHKKGFALLTFGIQSDVLGHWLGRGTFNTM